jgi:magnesium transporter
LNEVKLLEMIEKKEYVKIKERLSQMNEVDVADLLDPLDENTTLLIFRMLPKDLAVGVFAHFSSEQQSSIVNSITDKELTHILDELFFDDMIDMIEEMPANLVDKILKNSNTEERNLINQFLKYPVDSAGSIMTIEYVVLKKHMIVGEALAHIRKTGLNKETIYTCYVVNDKRILEGIVSLRNLVIADEDTKISDLMEEDIIYVHTHDDRESVGNLFIKYGFMALPVVDKENRLTGIITFDDILDVMEQEATEDFQIMAAMAPSEEKYLDASVMSLAKQRVPWLLLLMVGATITGGIITRFEGLLSSVVVLTAFIPMLMDTGGNSGNQSSTLIIRGLAIGEISFKDKWKVFWKEFRISIISGIILASVNFLKNILIDRVGLSVSLTVSLTLIVTVVLAKLIGSMLPLGAKKLNLDPAIMAGPLITTIVDAITLTVYFTFASILLGL